jgi:CBS domain containing-hemolysin-like protein
MEGVLDQDTATLLTRSLQFADRTAADVMTPRLRLATVARGDTVQDVLELARRTGFSRFPVTGDSIDDVTGLVHVKQAMAVPRERRGDVPVGAIEQEALRVPETMKLDLLLGELRGRGYQMAIVLDEYGGTAGVATLEDLVEELVGDLVDEHDRTRAGIVRGRDSLTFPGILRPDELADQAGVRVPESGLYETVAGYVVSKLGRLPKVGDEVPVEQGTLAVLRLDGRRIDRLRFTPDPEAVRLQAEAEAQAPAEAERRA